KYNLVAKKLDKRLSDLGATTIIEKGLGDDQHPSGYEGTLDPWMLSVLDQRFNLYFQFAIIWMLTNSDLPIHPNALDKRSGACSIVFIID
ncbi:hypothetical protein AALP_AAs66779U000100, partial [Arabis alpina]